MAATHLREMALARRLREGLAALPGVTVYSPLPRDEDVPIVTCNVAGIAPIDVGAILDADYGIAVRTGLHWRPARPSGPGHRRAGRGWRFSPGCFIYRSRHRLGAPGDDRHRRAGRSAVRPRRARQVWIRAGAPQPRSL